MTKVSIRTEQERAGERAASTEGRGEETYHRMQPGSGIRSRGRWLVHSAVVVAVSLTFEIYVEQCRHRSRGDITGSEGSDDWQAWPLDAC